VPGADSCSAAKTPAGYASTAAAYPSRVPWQAVIEHPSSGVRGACIATTIAS
jgi:hypothetical protein